MMTKRSTIKKRYGISQHFLRKTGAILIGLFAVGLVQAQTYTFKTGNATGQYGPTQTQINNAYASTTLAGKVLAVNGIQYWVVPQTGSYSVEATGARGYGTYGGRGAFMSGRVVLQAGDTLKIIVGQQGAPPVGSGTNQYGGGGGSFLAYVNNSPILIAGGGGGSWATSYNSTTDASTGTAGKSGANGPTNGAGGTNGSGGVEAATSGGGGGLTGDGGGGFYGGLSFINGGRGGRATTNGGEGGFGCGGGADSWDNRRAGGGGGYSGGGGAGSTTTGFPEGGGAGSYNVGNNQNNVAGIGTGDGSIVIKTLSTGATNDIGVIAIDSPSVYCAGIHNVVVTIQNFGINKIDSVRLNWSVGGALQAIKYFVGTIDTIGGSGSATSLVTLSAYNFGSSAYTVKVWSSFPNGVADTSNANDTLSKVKQVNLPPPTALSTKVVNATNATIKWKAGSVSNTWAYVNTTSTASPTGPGTVVNKDTAYISGLNERTTYYFWVREICQSGDSSSWAGPLVYRTPCANIFNGVYTINASQAPSATNFISFSAAAYALGECGVSGPVEFRVAAGTYTERVLLKEISGVSSTNTIRFIGAGIGSTILSNTGTGTANWSTVFLDGSDYFEFRDMTVRALGTVASIGFHLTNQANFNSFRNVRIEMAATATNANIWGIVGSGSATSITTGGDACNYTTMDSITTTGGYGGVSIYGTSTSVAHSYGNKVLNSNITGAYYYGIRFYYQNELELDRNRINSFRNTISYGLYVYYCSDYLVSNNEVISNYEALRLYYCDRYLMSGTFKSLTYNNILKAGSTYYAIYSYYSYDVNFYHNTVESSYTNGSYFYYNDNLDFRNNIIVNRNTSATGYLLYIVNGSQPKFDYNVFSGAGASFVYHDAAIANFTTWKQTFPYINENSVELTPTFKGVNNLRLDQSIPFLRGDPTLNIKDDVDGDIRCEIAPTIGADENFYQNPTPTALISREDSIYISSPTTFYSSFQPLPGLLWDYTWYVDDVLKSTDVNFMQTFTATGAYEVKLRARSCSGSDRDSIIVNMVTPTTVPVTDFTASKLVIDVLEQSILSDLSDFGATQWEWTAEPSYDAIFSNAYISNPSVIFLAPGEFKICLTTANGVGQGNKLCKDAYIKVNDDQTMCSSPESSLPAGRITDEGGPAGNYTANSSCNFVIRPCAGKVTLLFKQWVLSDGDDLLRVYDGTNNTGNLIGTFTGNSNIPGGINGLTANSGKMYLEWRTSAGGQAPGFIAYWTSAPDPNAVKPVADFTIPDTVFIGQIIKFVSTSTGDALNYAWDFDPPFQIAGLDGGKGSSDRYSWNTIGTYPVELKVSNCGGGDTVFKNIQVLAPTTAPVVGFYANRTKVPVLTTVTLKDSSFQGGTSWKWSVSPAVTTNLLSPDNETELKASFIKSGKYTVQLKVSNSVGVDSLIKIDYIEVFDYCAPVVGNVSSDVAISRVKFGSIDNFSDVGVNKYTSFLNEYTPEKVALRDSITLIIERQSNIDPMNRKVWVDWNNDGDFNDAGEEVASESSNTNLSFTTKFVVPQTAYIGYTTLRVGVSYDQNINRPCGINPTGEFEDYPIQVIIDNKAPIITLNGKDTVWVEKGYAYSDAGAVAMDNVDGNLTAFILINNSVDTSVVGTYKVRYNVKDLDGNAAKEVSRVVIITPDITRPVITLNGLASLSLTVGSSYIDAGATAEDYFKMDLTPQMQFSDNIDLNVLGTYYFWYTIQDASGNKDSVAREVNIIDDIAPILTLLGNDPLMVEVKTAINDPGYTVSDNYYASVFVKVDSSLVRITTVGTYTITYTALDGSGNSAVLTRTVIVQDNTKPILTLIGSDTVVVDVFFSYNEQGVQVQDNYCSGLNWTVDQQPNTNVLGDYTLSYSSTDCNGNTSLVLTRVVRVVDRKAPLLTLKGFAANSVYRWAGYNDPGVEIEDNYYSELSLQPKVIITSNFDPNWVGFYSICYQVTDPSGNKSNSVCRNINVLESITSLNDVNIQKYSIYPNPSNGNFTLAFGEILTEKATIRVYDMAGKLVFETTEQAGNKTLSMSLNLAKGIYQVAVSSNGYQQVLKVQISQ